MHCIRHVTEDLIWIGGNDRQHPLFESTHPVPRGMSFNSYLLLDEKTVLFDTVDRAIQTQFFENLEYALGGRKLDYVFVHHMEPDHAATLGDVMLRHPEATIVCNGKILNMIRQFHCTDPKEVHLVNEGDSITTGRHTFTFVNAPMVHWPEVMVSYDSTDKILFSADAFGTFGALNGVLFADEVNFDRDWLDDARRYLTNIVGKYGSPVQKALAKLGGLPISTICSTHGPVWTENIAKVIGIYDKLSRYAADEGVVIAYGSMYGNTEQMAEAIAAELSAQGIKNIVMHNVSKSNPSYIIADIFKYRGLIIGSPTYSNQIYPEIESLLSKILVREVKGRYLGYFGSFCWAGAAVKRMGEFAEKSKFEIVGDPVEMKQAMKDITYEQCENLARAMAERLKKDRK